MPESRRVVKAFVPAFVLLLGCLFVWGTRRQRPMPLVAPLASVLDSLPGYRVEEQRFSADEQRVAGMSDYVSRIYWHDSVPAFITLVSYYERQTQGKTIHSPRNCLPGAGWEVLTAGRERVVVDGTGQVLNRYLLKNGASTAVVFYWYQGRGRVVASEYTVKWNLLRDAALAGHTEEALVRVVVPILAKPGDMESDESRRRIAAADSLGASVAARMVHDVARALPSVRAAT